MKTKYFIFGALLLIGCSHRAQVGECISRYDGTYKVTELGLYSFLATKNDGSKWTFHSSSIDNAETTDCYDLFKFLDKPAKAEEEVSTNYKFRIGEKVKAIEKGNLYDGCVGEIADGSMLKDGPMYLIQLEKCPHSKMPKKLIRAGEEYLELVR